MLRSRKRKRANQDLCSLHRAAVGRVWDDSNHLARLQIVHCPFRLSNQHGGCTQLHGDGSMSIRILCEQRIVLQLGMQQEHSAVPRTGGILRSSAGAHGQRHDNHLSVIGPVAGLGTDLEDHDATLVQECSQLLQRHRLVFNDSGMGVWKVCVDPFGSCKMSDCVEAL